MSTTIFFIVNTRIGDKKIAEFKDAVSEHIAHKPHQIHYTEYGGHAIELAQAAIAQHASLVVAVGGDGTVNEVLQSMVYADIPMAIVPTGSGNGLARHCSIPITINDAVKIIADNHFLKIDVGKINEKYFISNAGVGFDAWVCNNIKQSTSRGLKMYIQEVIKSYFNYKPAIYNIQADNKTIVEKGYFLNFANGKEFGYGFQIAPNASLQDGLLDMVLVKKINLLTGIKFVWDGWQQNIMHNSNCIHITAKKFTIESDDLKYFQVDGDAMDCDGKCSIELFPKSLKLIVPKSIQKI